MAQRRAGGDLVGEDLEAGPLNPTWVSNDRTRMWPRTTTGAPLMNKTSNVLGVLAPDRRGVEGGAVVDPVAVLAAAAAVDRDPQVGHGPSPEDVERSSGSLVRFPMS